MSITVKKKTGVSNLKTDKIRRTLERACENISHVNVEEIYAYVVNHLYDGMTTKQIEDLLITSAETFIEFEPEYNQVAVRLFLQKLQKEVFGKSTTEQERESLYKQSFPAYIKHAVEIGLLDKRMLDYDLNRLADFLDWKRDYDFDYMGIQTLYERYFVKDGEKRLELPQYFFMRVAMGLCLNETNKEEHVLELYSMYSFKYALPSTPTLFHSGLVHSQLASCYLNMVEDDLSHIFKVAGDNAQMAKYSGGLGTDVTNVRATGALIESTKVESQGVIPFLKIYNDVCVAINRSGKRRGAGAIYCEVWHLDFEDIIDLKKNTGDERRRTHDLHIANWVPDLFVKRVLEDGSWTFFSPNEVPELHEIYGKAFEEKYLEYEKLAKEGKLRQHKTVKAKDLWRRMLTSLFETGANWQTWKDAFNVRSPQDHVGVIHNTNLCTEIGENNSKDETAVCNLLSINLAEFVVYTEDGEPVIQFDVLRAVIKTSVRSLDNVIDINFYPTIEGKNSNLRHRPVGMGLMGWQDLLFKMGIPFDDEKAVLLADRLQEFISYYAIDASADLAKEKGAYSTFKGSKWDRGIFPLDTLNLLEQERGVPVEVNRDSFLGQAKWDDLKAKVKQNGMRNSLLMAIAPTATISNILGSYPCIESAYKNIYTKSNRNGEFTVINKYLVNDLRKLGLWTRETLEDIKLNNGSIQKIQGIPRKLKQLYKEAFEIDAIDCIKQTAVRGKWIDQSQSHNVFVPKEIKGKQLSNIYITAWKMGLKSTYYLRTLGASTIEKATTKRVGLSNGQAEAKIEDEPKQFCSIDNPDCESCQ